MADESARSGGSVVKENTKKKCKSAQEERKILRTQGQAYVTASKKFIRAKNPPGAEDVCKCYYKCKEISIEQRIKLFKEFYKITSTEKQGTFLMGHISILQIKRRRNGNYATAPESKRQCTVSYTLPDGKGNVVPVCRKTFQSVFDLTQKKMFVLVERMKKGEIVYKETRGNKTVNRKYKPEDVEAIKEHVAAFPRQESHYGRSRSQKEYLSPDLNLSRLYKAFKVKHPETHISQKFFSDTFKKEFKNVKFGRKRTDTCATCDLLSAQIKANPPDKNQLMTKLEIHQRKANKALDMLSSDVIKSQMPTSESCTATMDLQQVLVTPTLTHSQVYYSRQLSNFNLGIHICDTNDGHMCLWHEGITGRGGNEIASCVKKILCREATPKRKLIMWSDNCAGQNKNRMMVLLWQYLVILGVFDEIHHKFLMTGHSFLNCDRDFALIERRKKKCSPMVPADIKKMIEESRDKPFKVTVMDHGDFLDFQKAADSVIQTDKLSISKAQWIKVKRSEPHRIRVRETFNTMEAWKIVNVLKRNKTVNDLNAIVIPQLQCSSKITAAKKKDLLAMVPYLRKAEDKQFYLDLLQ